MAAKDHNLRPTIFNLFCIVCSLGPGPRHLESKVIISRTLGTGIRTTLGVDLGDDL